MAELAKKYCSLLWKLICSMFIWTVFSFTVVPIVIILVTIRFVSSKLAPRIYEDTSHIVSTISSVFGVYKDEDKCHVFSCFAMEGRIALEELRSTFESRVIHKVTGNGQLQWPELQQYIVHRFGFPFWQWDRTFDLQNHIRVLELEPKSGQSGSSPQEVLDIIEGKLLHQPFQPKKSPWELIIVPNFHDTPKYGNQLDEARLDTLLLFRFDHALGDGTAVLNLFEELFKGEVTPSSEVCSKGLNLFSSLWNTINLYSLGPYELFTIGTKGAKYHWSPNKKKLRYNTAVTPTIPLETIKKIRAANKNAAFSAIILVSIGNAVYRFMTEAGYKVPETIYFTLPRRANNHPVTKLTNHVTAVHTAVPMRRDPKQVECVQESLDVYTKSRVAEMYFRVTKLFGALQTTLFEWAISSVALDGEMIFANIQFPKDAEDGKQMYKIRSIFFLGRANAGGNGIVVNSSGCKEGVRFIFQIDEGIVPRHQQHAEVFVKYFLEELDSLSR